jgi:Sec-independent protein translocase protein TatA
MLKKVILIIFSIEKMPEIGSLFGQSIARFRKAIRKTDEADFQMVIIASQ